MGTGMGIPHAMAIVRQQSASILSMVMLMVQCTCDGDCDDINALKNLLDADADGF